MRLTYVSDDFKGVKVDWIIKLFSNGIVETYYEVSSEQDLEMISTDMDFRFSLENSYIPYEDGIIRMTDDSQADMDYFKSEKVSENWIFAKHKDYTRGVCWSKSNKMELKGYKQGIYSDFTEVKKNEPIRTDSMHFALNIFSDYEDFRAFAMKNNNLPKLMPVDITEIIINDGNPFIQEEIKLEYKDHKIMKNHVELKISDNENIIHEQGFILPQGGNKEIVFNENIDTNILKIQYSTDIAKLDKEVLVLKKEEGTVKMENLILENKKVLQLDNGLLKFNASAEYHNGIYSLEFKGEEYLDNRFPKAEAKGWFKPYTGGNVFIPEDAGFLTSFNEEKTCEFVKMKDQYGNLWSGIKTILEFKENEKFKGMILEQIYLTQYKQPIVISLFSVENKTGRYIEKQSFQVSNFIDKENNPVEFMTRDSQNNRRTHRCNGINRDIIAYDSISYKIENKSNILNVKYMGAVIHEMYSCVDFDMDNGFYENSIENNEKKNIGRSIMIFNENEILSETMAPLENIKFEII